MVAGLKGRLVTASFVRDLLAALPGTEPPPPPSQRALEAWFDRVDSVLGPAASLRAIAEVAAVPLMRILGYTLRDRVETPRECVLRFAGRRATVTMHVIGWGAPLDAVWRTAVLDAIAGDARWVLCCNGISVRIVDGQRTWSRDYLEVDLASTAGAGPAQTVLWSLAGAAGMDASPPLLDTAAAMSARHGIDVCRALGAGVLRSIELLLTELGGRRDPPALLFEQSLTMLYRVLFLLFAEARGLVPVWHPVYRDRYSIESIVASLLAGRPYRGLWHTLQAIARLAHAGYASPTLRVTAFNGKLFAPGHARALDRRPLRDEVLGAVVLALGTTGAGRPGQRGRIGYRDLDVEQLGAVYEQVLDYEPGRPGTTVLERTGDARKSSGTFYTPRAVTAAVVRRTLEPLVRGRTADEILALRVLDPAMGSGAFLVGACRYLARAAEEALVRDGRWHAHDVTPADRAELRRTIASRCLFGVDLNPMAVQLARLSLWLVTLAADKPLSFLDHHLVAGDSLIGASPADLRRQPSRTGPRRPRGRPLSLFAGDDLAPVLQDAARTRSHLTLRPDDSAATVQEKERQLAALDAPGNPLARWRAALDLWCAGWFGGGDRSVDRGTFQALVDHALHGRSTLPQSVAAPLLARARDVAAAHKFHHWELAFPEVFVDERGERRPGAGFDAVIGNPPWDMIRGDSGQAAARDSRRRNARQVTDFVREAGIYRVESRSHVNRYQLFVERAMQLARDGGRIGLVVPAGVVSDAGSAPLRRFLFGRADVDSVTGLDNREGIFPIHRSVRFVLLTATTGTPTVQTRCRFGITRTDDLERDGDDFLLSRDFLVRLSGEEDLGIPELTSRRDLEIVERIAAAIPRLGSTAGWNVSFGRELNATDDRAAFVPATGLRNARPIVEGKQVEPFRVSLDRCRFDLAPGAAAARRFVPRPRLAYRDVASAGNRLTLIAAIIPPAAVTTHTLFCLRNDLPQPSQLVLCALLNSFVANYLIRMRVSTHVTASLMSRLPVPLLTPADPAFDRLAHLATALQRGPAPVEEMPEYTALQAIAAAAYGLRASDFEHVLETFPLIPATVRQAALRDFTRRT